MRGRRLRIELVNDNSQKRRFDSHSSDNHRISESMFSDWRSESRSDSSNDSYRKNFSRSNKSDHTDVVDTVDSVSNWRNSSNGIFQTKRHTTDIANTDLRTNKMENHNQNNKLSNLLFRKLSNQKWIKLFSPYLSVTFSNNVRLLYLVTNIF